MATTCAILQDLRGDHPFYLSGPLVTKILDAHRAQLPEGQRYRQRCREWCWRALQQLVTERVLLLVAKGNQHKANTYRFIWTPETDIVTAEPAWITQLLPSMPT